MIELLAMPRVPILPDCSICFSVLASDLGCLKCGHVFHSECILKWLAEKQLCPLCKQTVHRSHIRNLFYTVSFSNNDEGSQATPISLVDTGSTYDALVQKLRAESREYQSKFSDCTDKLRQKDTIISELAMKNRVLELDQERHLADTHTYKIKLETLKQSSSEQAACLQSYIKNLERQISQLQNEQKIKSAVQEQNKEGHCDISAIKKQCKAMAPDMRIKFLLSQLAFTNDFCSQLQKRSSALERDLRKARQQNSAVQSLDQTPRRNDDTKRSDKHGDATRTEEIIDLDDEDTQDGEYSHIDAAKTSKELQNDRAFTRATPISMKKRLEMISSIRTSSLHLPAARNEQSISVSLEKPSMVKKAHPRSVLNCFSLNSNSNEISSRPDRGPTGTGGTSSTLSRISSTSLKDRFRSSTNIVSSSKKTPDIRTLFKRSYSEMERS